MNAFTSALVNTVINPLIRFMFAIAILVFLWGVVEFIMNLESEEKRSTGKLQMIWGIIGISAMMGVWFWLGLILRTFHVQGITINHGQIHVKIVP